ncbi:25715_t:CDS:2 [Dentiscutata erythropus]|uniref:25715_t:CDS:1 n=1 Tax=Dentiscutata erythropus TaxID=1348616 RepID=A0A9N9DK27_9GLOM|nr:25715_t:CDS:2 [Dentiscutata erythropus]
MKNNSIFSRNRKIHNPFKKRNSPSGKSHSHSVHQQNVISALGGMPHDFDFDFQSATETPTAKLYRIQTLVTINHGEGQKNFSLSPNNPN